MSASGAVERDTELDERSGTQGSIIISYFSSTYLIALPSIQQSRPSVLYFPGSLHRL